MRGTHHSRHFGNTAQAKERGTAKPEGIKEVSDLKGSITDGFNRIEAWIKAVVSFEGGTVLSRLGALAYKVIVYNVATDKEMKTLIEHVVEKAIAISEQKTEAKLDNLKLSMKLTTARPRYKDS
ncbi:hypothetical protein Q9L58_001079 [Maublancomyces gigas]|uniref:Uncharacterized protein n=1 Tax=Discina gigas TaxID=1032678 RepID=A0ABR3GV22_9PEZI